MLEAATGFEPVIKVLQTFALPLGHAAVSAHEAFIGKKVGVAAPTSLRWSGRRDSNPRPSPWQGDALPAEPLPPVSQFKILASPTGGLKRSDAVYPLAAGFFLEHLAHDDQPARAVLQGSLEFDDHLLELRLRLIRVYGLGAVTRPELM